MRFYIYQNGSLVEKKANLQAISEDVKDETLDTASVELYFDDSAEAYPPRALCKIIDFDKSSEKGYRETYYHIATDNVAIQTLSPRTYKHTLTLVQTTRKLSHYVLPNMVVSKPREGVVSTYFANTNELNQAYYTVDFKAQPSGISSWDGFIGRIYTNTYTPFTNRGGAYGSPYWGECVALSSTNKIQRARIKVHWLAMVCEVTLDSEGKLSSATATPTKLSRALACPDWLTPKFRVYHSDTNVNMARTDADIAKDVIAEIPLTSVTWGKDYGYIDLTEAQLNTLNGYDSGYVMCELYSELTGTLPSSLYTEGGTDIRGAHDRLFIDKTEFTKNNIQAVWSNVQMELTYQQVTLYDVLQRIIDRQQCKWSLSTNKPLFSLPTSGDDYEVLKNTEAPEFYFTNLTVFEAVSQVLETIDALPRFDCDDDGNLVLGIDYFNQTGDKVSEDTKFASYVSNATEQKRDNGILANFQNAEVLCKFPCAPFQGTPTYARASVSSYGLPELNDFALAVDKPIKYIRHLWVQGSMEFRVVWQSATTYSWGDYQYGNTFVDVNFPIDLASFIFDEATYSSALDQRKDYTYSYTRNERLQMNCLRFKQGNKYISIGNKATSQWNKVFSMFNKCCEVASNRIIGNFCINHSNEEGKEATVSLMYDLKYPDDFKFKDIWFSCEYVSDINGRLEIQSPYPKETGQFITSTGSSSPDLGKLGLNMLGVALKSGEPTMTCSQMIGDWSERIKVGDIFTKNDEKWIATKASYTRLIASVENSEVIKGTIEFTKNFNGLSRRIAIDQSKRLYNIDRSIATLCEMNIVNYAYFEPVSSVGTKTNEGEDIAFNEVSLGEIIMKAFTTDETAYSNVSYAEVTSYNKGEQVAYQIYAPLSVYGAGNCLCFEAKFDDPISAGIKMTAKDSGSTGLWWLDGYAGLVADQTYYNGSDIKYASGEGYADYFHVMYMCNDGQGGGKFPDTFPDLASEVAGSRVGWLSTLKFDKQPNEIFGVNYEVAFLSRYHQEDNEVFFGKAFFDTWNELKSRRSVDLKFYYSEDTAERYDYASRKGKGSNFLVTANTSYDDTKGSYLFFTRKFLATKTEGHFLASYAVCDQDDNILIACNCNPSEINFVTQKLSSKVSPAFHFFTKQERL